MRRRAMPVSWPRRDPRHYRFTMPNAVWEYNLRPVEFVIFSYLCYRHTPGVLTPEMIAVDVHMTTSTAKKYLGSLVGKRLVNKDGTPALCCMDEKFFTLPNEIFLLRLPPSAFMIYAYLLLIEDRRTHTCHPSYNTIAAATGMSRNTVIKSICVLLNKGLIEAEHSHYLDQHGLKWNGNNLYTILPAQQAVDQFHQQQLDRLESEAVCWRVRKRQKKYDLRHPRATCTLLAPGVSDPTSAL